ncbi:TIGR04086 family membrane protein [Paenibacillus thailandensis]|uniref:TIGR04086 family membrane protein n=1 Tax=Paenibacillus thailandensis TaxID=393250 RepID=A0ABW5QS07_9BACL
MSVAKQTNAPKISSPFLAGILWSIIWLAAGALLLSLLLQYSNVKEDNLPMYSMVVHGFSAFAGGFVSAKRSGRRGWYYGGFLGLLYGIAILLISFLAVDASLSLRSLTLLLTALLTGALGGIIGVNLGRSS